MGASLGVSRLTHSGDNPELRDGLDDAVVDGELALTKSFAAAIDRYAAKLPAVADENVDPELVLEILAAEEAALRDACQAEIAAPLLPQPETNSTRARDEVNAMRESLSPARASNATSKRRALRQ